MGKQVVNQDNPLNLPVYPLAEAVSIMEDTVRSYNGLLDGRVSAWAMPFASEFCTTDLLVAAKDIAEKAKEGGGKMPEAITATVTPCPKAFSLLQA